MQEVWTSWRGALGLLGKQAFISLLTFQNTMHRKIIKDAELNSKCLPVFITRLSFGEPVFNGIHMLTPLHFNGSDQVIVCYKEVSIWWD